MRSKSENVVDKDLDIQFVPDLDGSYSIEAIGKNQFGNFTMRGTLEPSSVPQRFKVEIFRIYDYSQLPPAPVASAPMPSPPVAKAKPVSNKAASAKYVVVASQPISYNMLDLIPFCPHLQAQGNPSERKSWLEQSRSFTF